MSAPRQPWTAQVAPQGPPRSSSLDGLDHAEALLRGPVSATQAPTESYDEIDPGEPEAAVLDGPTDVAAGATGNASKITAALQLVVAVLRRQVEAAELARSERNERLDLIESELRHVLVGQADNRARIAAVEQALPSARLQWWAVRLLLVGCGVVGALLLLVVALQVVELVVR